MSVTVLITGGRAPVALDLARKFARSGARVVVAESSRAQLCARSSAVAVSYRVPPPNRAPEAFADALADIVKLEGVRLVVPTCEEIFWVARGRKRLPCEVLAEPLGTLRALHSKWEFVQLAKGFGLPVPETALVTSQADLAGIRRPFILKPVFSRFGTKVRVVRGNIALRAGEGPWVAQELLGGQQICTYSVAVKGRLVAHAAYAVEFTASGACVSFEPVEHAEVDAWVTEFVARAGFSGQIAFDFMAGDRVLPMECNPRATSGVHLLGDELAGVLLGDVPDRPLRPAPGTRAMIGLAMLGFGLAGVRSWPELRRWASVVSAADDVIAVEGDRGPFLAQFGVLWENWIRSLWTRRSLIECSTYDIEWDGR
ncbi:ATP-grasp domain-containing protein [Nonomuraea sp. NPDC052129]|uniref:ATP-grasp domain-containing protein n=1 Tax=Nonomuraea sp. NPDC052129 TaxID=3154651 RepID=UPI00341AB672